MRQLKVVIAGGRDFNDFDKLTRVCDNILKNIDKVEIISGVAIGADRLGELYAKQKGYTLHQFPAEWDVYGKSAGYKRNVRMAEFSDAVIVFWNGNSKGTSHMINAAKSANKPIRIIKY